MNDLIFSFIIYYIEFTDIQNVVSAYSKHQYNNFLTILKKVYTR